MDFILKALTKMMHAMSLVLGKWTFTRNLAGDFALIMPYFKKANMLLPMSDLLSVLGLWVGLQVVLIAYYWINRAINLLRGAG